MITKKQHHQICQKLSALYILGVPLETYTGNRIVKVDTEKDEILVSNNTRLTWRSYAEHTKLKDAWGKFIIPRLTLYQIKNYKIDCRGFIIFPKN